MSEVELEQQQTDWGSQPEGQGLVPGYHVEDHPAGHRAALVSVVSWT